MASFKRRLDEHEQSTKITRRRLAYNKCSQCRKDKQKCLPEKRMWPEKCQRCTEKSLECSENRTTKTDLRRHHQSGLIEKDLDTRVQDLYVTSCIIFCKSDLSNSSVDLHYMLSQYAQLIATMNSNEHLNPFNFVIFSYEDMFNEFCSTYQSQMDEMIEACKEKRMSALMYLLSSIATPTTTSLQTQNDKMTWRADRERMLIDFVHAKASYPTISSFEHFITSCQARIGLQNGRQGLDEAIVQFIQYHKDVVERAPGMQSRFQLDLDVRPTPLLCQAGLNTFGHFLDRLSVTDQMLAETDYFERTMLHCVFDVERPTNVWQKLEWYRTQEQTLDWRTCINQADTLRRTPLHVACRRDLPIEVVTWLLDQGAEIESRDLGGQTPLSIAAEYGHAKLVYLLIDKNAEINCRDGNDQTPLSHAAENGDEAVVELLLVNGADVSIPDWRGRTPLHYAAEKGHQAVMKLLFDYEADADFAATEGTTPLLLAAIGGHEAAAKLLIDNGADVDVADEMGRTPLMDAAIQHHEAVMRLLLAAGANVDFTRFLW